MDETLRMIYAFNAWNECKQVKFALLKQKKNKKKTL